MGNGNGTYCLESLVQIVEEVHGEWLESLALKGGGDIGEEEGLSQETITERRPLGRQLTRWWAGLLGYFISSFYPFPVYSSVVNFVPHYKDTMELTFSIPPPFPLFIMLSFLLLSSPPSMTCILCLCHLLMTCVCMLLSYQYSSFTINTCIYTCKMQLHRNPYSSSFSSFTLFLHLAYPPFIIYLLQLRDLPIEFDLSQLLIVVDTLCQLLHCLHVIFLQLNPFL